MKALIKSLYALALVALLCSAVPAQDDMGGMEGMPMGAPEEMKEMQFMVGDWVGDMKWRMADTSTEWMDAKSHCSYEMVLDGGALKGNVSIDMMGMTMTGISMDCYDREKKQWQTMWIDSMTPRMRIYTGSEQDGKIVYTGEEIMMGQTIPSKLIIVPKSETEFYWEMQYSNDGGETWWTSGKATYTKQG